MVGSSTQGIAVLARARQAANRIVKNCKIVNFSKVGRTRESLECAAHFKRSSSVNTSQTEKTLKNRYSIRFGLALVLTLAAATAIAQVYSWRDLASGQRRFSNIPPPWYSRGEQVRGPRVVATIGERVIDDTALPYEQRLRLSGKSQDYIDKLRLQKQPGPAPQQQAKQAADNSSVR